MKTSERSLPALAALLLLICAGLAPSRAAAQGSAGYQGGFFVRSADGDNELRIGGVFQYRWVRSGVTGGSGQGDPALAGFQYRRLQVDVQGHFMSPRWTYRLRLDAANGGTLAPAHAWVAYDLGRGLSVRVGQTKPSFLHEENVSGTNQLAAERSYTADYFTTDFAQLVQVTHRPRERLTLVGTLHSGSYSFRTDFDNDLNDLALAARAEVLLVAEDPARAWGRFGDFQAWTGESPAVLVGAAVDWESAESGGPGAWPDLLKWTVDLNVKAGRGALFVSAVGQRLSADGPPATGVPPTIDGAGQLGLVAQGTWLLGADRWAAFGRLETIDFDGVYYRLNQGAVQGGTRALAADRLSIVTLGGTLHLRKHAAKLTLDLTRALDAVPVSNTGSGLLRTEADAQTAIRAQLQVRF